MVSRHFLLEEDQVRRLLSMKSLYCMGKSCIELCDLHTNTAFTDEHAKVKIFFCSFLKGAVYFNKIHVKGLCQ